MGVFLAYTLDEWIRGLLMWRRWVRLDWLLPYARASHRRLRQGEATRFRGQNGRGDRQLP